MVPSFFSNKKLIVLLVSMITMVIVVGSTIKERPLPTWTEQFLRDSVGFVQSIVYKPTRAIAGFFETIIEIRHLNSENQMLKANLQENVVLLAKMRELEEENKHLKELLDAESNLSEYQLRTAEVIMRSPDRWYQQVTINKGKKQGIKPNMAVVTPKGLVGRIKSTAQFTSVVELLTDVNRVNHVSAVVQGNDLVFGVIEGYDTDGEALYFQKIPIDAPLEVGQTVITSGLGGLYPRGLYIGQVTEIIPDEYGLTQAALVKPAANMYHLDKVFVVERMFLPADDLSSTEQSPTEGNEGARP